MALLSPFFMFLRGGTEGDEAVDRPLTNFDVLGVPTDKWSSGLLACHENIFPSCFMAFCCPCFQWAQIAVRGQVPLLIGLKNSFACSRRFSGYGLFVEYFFWSLLVALVLLIVLVVVTTLPPIVFWLFVIAFVVVFGGWAYLMGHTRTAFKEKYSLPSDLPNGCGFWEMLLDALVAVACMPCSLAQMSRHVFQYDRMDTQLGLFFSDPSTLPPLPPLPEQASNGPFIRPEVADAAGLHWTNNRTNPHVIDNRGAAHRQREIVERQVQGLRSTGVREPSAPTAAATAAPMPVPTYRPDGSMV